MMNDRKIRLRGSSNGTREGGGGRGREFGFRWNMWRVKVRVNSTESLTLSLPGPLCKGTRGPSHPLPSILGRQLSAQ